MLEREKNENLTDPTCLNLFSQSGYKHVFLISFNLCVLRNPSQPIPHPPSHTHTSSKVNPDLGSCSVAVSEIYFPRRDSVTDFLP